MHILCTPVPQYTRTLSPSPDGSLGHGIPVSQDTAGQDTFISSCTTVGQMDGHPLPQISDGTALDAWGSVDSKAIRFHNFSRVSINLSMDLLISGEAAQHMDSAHGLYPHSPGKSEIRVRVPAEQILFVIQCLLKSNSAIAIYTSLNSRLLLGVHEDGLVLQYLADKRKVEDLSLMWRTSANLKFLRFCKKTFHSILLRTVRVMVRTLWEYTLPLHLMQLIVGRVKSMRTLISPSFHLPLCAEIQKSVTKNLKRADLFGSLQPMSILYSRTTVEVTYYKDDLLTVEVTYYKDDLLTVEVTYYKDDLLTKEVTCYKDDLLTVEVTYYKGDLLTVEVTYYKDDLLTVEDDLLTEEVTCYKDDLLTVEVTYYKGDLLTVEVTYYKGDLLTVEVTYYKDDLLTVEVTYYKDDLLTVEVTYYKDDLLTVEVTYYRGDLLTVERRDGVVVRGELQGCAVRRPVRVVVVVVVVRVVHAIAVVHVAPEPLQCGVVVVHSLTRTNSHNYESYKKLSVRIRKLKHPALALE
ncbi:hypothetical protein J6590_003630 [Homalodisca vitripennis]|nr:hypothetical protein J6590_003630 [Homalodisca vitripennis]